MKFNIAIFFFFFSLYVTAQNRATLNYLNEPISVVFSELEEKFNIKFSYNSELVNDRFITLQLKEALLEDILFFLEEKAAIRIKKESERYYTVKSRRLRLTDTQELDEVLIEEYLTTGISKKNDDASISLSPQKLGILPGLTEPDVLQSIQLIPGVQSPTETAAGLYIRGGTPDQNLILWDGIKMYHSGHFFGTISAFNPYITDEIKVYKNGTKARYGNRISGVIDITSDSEIPKEINGGFGFNMTHADAYLKAPLDNKSAVMVSARRSITDAFDTETFRNLSQRVFQETKISDGNKIFEDDEFLTTKDIFYFTDFTVKAMLKPNAKNQFTISSLYTKNKLDYGFLIEEFEEASQDKLEIINQGTSFNWNHESSESFSHELNVYISDFELDYIGSNSITDEFSDALNKQNKIQDLGFSFDTDWKLNSTKSLGLGYQFSSNKVAYGLNFIDSEAPEENFDESNIDTNNTQALYLEYRYKTKNKWFINAGIRTNYFSVSDQLFVEPRVQIERALSSSLRFKISGESLHQAVSQIVEFNTQEFGLENQIWALSDGVNIPVLESAQLTAGFILDYSGWNVDIEGYYRNIQGLTSFTLGFDNIDDFFSKGKSNVFGLDVLIKKKIQNYRTWLSYSIMNNDFTFDNINNGESFSGNTDITHHLTWSHTYEWNRFNVSLGWNIRTGIPYTKAAGLIDTPDGTVIDFKETNGARLPNYDRVDISATYKFNVSTNEKWKGKLGVSLLNLYNKENILSRTYEKRQSTTETGEVLREVNRSSLGITPNVVFRLEF
ncbi:TonB-dependent receptor [uncultured Algibacter sp.]|uniref:TonB-dependent receptor plug domain-containing protein n=1 Tax=uncultured Algibacter sp. TaxID=298659 RepID=UPI00260F3AA1|nr:TonB-dependent receptor [uncultured Algibacter sp.]